MGTASCAQILTPSQAFLIWCLILFSLPCLSLGTSYGSLPCWNPHVFVICLRNLNPWILLWNEHWVDMCHCALIFWDPGTTDLSKWCWCLEWWACPVFLFLAWDNEFFSPSWQFRFQMASLQSHSSTVTVLKPPFQKDSPTIFHCKLFF